jgi:renalase
MRIAIIGAGISGLFLANRLSESATVTVFEKSRGVGGRMSTRYADPYYFDHGALYFTAHSASFKDFLAPHLHSGVVSTWEGNVAHLQADQPNTIYSFDDYFSEPVFVASPNMNSLCKALAQGLNICLCTEIAPLDDRNNGVWRLKDTHNRDLGEFDWVISTAPFLQTSRLFSQFLGLKGVEDSSLIQCAFSLMIGSNQAWTQNWQLGFAQDSTVSIVSVNSSKPQRNSTTTSLVIQSHLDWAHTHIDADLGWVQSVLLNDLIKLTHLDSRGFDYVSLHRWRYSRMDAFENLGSCIDMSLNLAISCDGFSDSSIESRWRHAEALVQKLDL